MKNMKDLIEDREELRKILADRPDDEIPYDILDEIADINKQLDRILKIPHWRVGDQE